MERYWITGVQLGILQEQRKSGREKLVNQIIEEQFIGTKDDLDAMIKAKKNIEEVQQVFEDEKTD